MGRLIDADALIKELVRMKESCVDVGLAVGITHAICAVDGQPTAYDVEKVVAELEYQKEHFEKDRTYWADHTWKDNVVYCNWDLSDKKVNCYESAIDIVRRGGVK